MIDHRAAAVALLGAGVLLSACAPVLPARTVTVTAPPSTVTVTLPGGASASPATPANPAESIEVKVGERKTVAVGETNSSVGYSWTLVDKGDAHVASVDLTPPSNPVPCTGCGYAVQLDVTGVSVGTTTARVEFKAREGLNTTNPPRTYTIKVIK